MNNEIKNLWLDALRSGEYQQAKKSLKTEDGFCCLGVLCDLHHQYTGKGNWELRPNGYFYVTENIGSIMKILPREVAEWAGLDSLNPEVFIPGDNEYTRCLSNYNDHLHYSFYMIASVIEKYL